MKAEFMTIWALLLLATSLNLCKLQIFNDSQVVIDWVNDKAQVQGSKTTSINEKDQELLSDLEWYTCAHVYRELNQMVDKLSKEALEIEVEHLLLPRISE
jgi:ribonuclease HI